MSVVVIREPGGVVVVQEPSEAPVVVERTRTQVVEIAGSGPQGIQGEPGADSTVPGPPGAPGGSFDYVHDQAIPSATWTIVHGLSGYPNVTVVDSGGTEVIGNINYVDANTIVATFAGAFGGNAYLS